MKFLRCLLIVILIFVGIFVTLISGCFIYANVKHIKSSVDSPDGKFKAFWNGNDGYTDAYIVNNFTKKRSKSLWEYKEAAWFCFGEDLPTLDEGGVVVEKYEIVWKNKMICIFKIYVQHRMSGEKEILTLKCNAETFSCGSKK